MGSFYVGDRGGKCPICGGKVFENGSSPKTGYKCSECGKTSPKLIDDNAVLPARKNHDPKR